MCRFSIGDVGKAPAASTSIDNGFEYHLRAFTLALDDYVAARQQELDEQARSRGEAEQVSSAFGGGDIGPFGQTAAYRPSR